MGNTSEMSMDKIYTVDDYYDGPVSGVADLNGKPHYYECIFDEETDEYSKVYRLSPISENTLRLVQEQWDIWLRWNETFKDGKIKISTHPALPEDEERCSEIEALTKKEKTTFGKNYSVMLAEFVVPKVPGWASIWYVEWSSNIT